MVCPMGCAVGGTIPTGRVMDCAMRGTRPMGSAMGSPQASYVLRAFPWPASWPAPWVVP